MIKDPVLLEIRRQVPRPPAALVARLGAAPTGFLVDAMDGRGALDYRIKAVDPAAGRIAGVAVTCHCGPADNLALAAAMTVAAAGDVIVAATDGFTATAVVGDLMLGMMRNRGLAGMVTDGLARDLPGLRRVGLPLFCAGITPNSPTRSGPGTVNAPVVLGGVAVEPGDIVVGDQDGVVVVPQRRAAAVAERLAEIEAAEAALDAKVAAGAVELGPALGELLASPQIRWIG